MLELTRYMGDEGRRKMRWNEEWFWNSKTRGSIKADRFGRDENVWVELRMIESLIHGHGWCTLCVSWQAHDGTPISQHFMARLFVYRRLEHIIENNKTLND
jgi:hypothetical protein